MRATAALAGAASIALSLWLTFGGGTWGVPEAAGLPRPQHPSASNTPLSGDAQRTTGSIPGASRDALPPPPRRRDAGRIPPVNATDLRTARFSDMPFYKVGNEVPGGGAASQQGIAEYLVRGLPLASAESTFFSGDIAVNGDAGSATPLYPCNRAPPPPAGGRVVTIWVPDAPRMTQDPIHCPVSCRVRSEKTRGAIEASDAVVVDSARSWSEDWKIYDWRSNPLKKILIGWNIENIEGRRKMLARSYKHRYIGRDYNATWWDVFNISVSYPMGSDVPLNYYNWAMCRDRATSEGINRFSNPGVSKKVKRAAAFVSSNCEFTSHWRDAVVQVLRNHFPVHGYGKCMHSHDIRGVAWCKGSDMSKKSVQKACLMSQYPFTLVVENSVSIDYVTEKVYEPLLAGSVPIYLGAPNVENFLPTTRSVIKMSDFPSLGALARYLDCLLEHPEYLQEYLDWRKRPAFRSWKVWAGAYPPLCTACMRIHSNDLNRRRRPHFIPYTIDENRGSQEPVPFCYAMSTAAKKR